MKRLFAIILCIVSFLALFGCVPFAKSNVTPPISSSDGSSGLDSENPSTTEDEKKPTINVEKLPVSLLSYESIDYNGGFTETYIFDFDNNVVKRRRCMPDQREEVAFDVIAEFSEEEEAKLLDTLYTNGFFEIDAYYPAPPDIIDGGGWELNVEFCNGTTKKSIGENNGPGTVFNNCATAFFDICGEAVIGYVPREYYTPPNVDYTIYTFQLIIGGGLNQKRADYKWNGFESSNNNIYEINEANVDSGKLFSTGMDYLLVMSTANYGKYEDYDEFQKCTVTSYDYNEKMTNETVLYDGGWFERIEINICLYQIYVVRLEFENGDFVEYTFNTVPTSVE